MIAGAASRDATAMRRVMAIRASPNAICWCTAAQPSGLAAFDNDFENQARTETILWQRRGTVRGCRERQTIRLRPPKRGAQTPEHASRGLHLSNAMRAGLAEERTGS